MIRYSKEPKRVRGSESYYARVNRDGKRSWYSLQTSDLKEARKRLRDLQRGAVVGQDLTAPKEKKSPVTTLSQAARRWLEAKAARCAPRTAECYQTYAKCWVNALGPNTPVREVAAQQVEDFIQSRKKDGDLSPVTMNNHITWMRSMFTWLQKQGIVDRNPVIGIERFRTERKAIRTLTLNEEDKVLSAARSIDAAAYGFVLTLVKSGLRAGCVSQLRWEHDVCLASGTWKIRPVLMKAKEEFVAPIESTLLQHLRKIRKDEGLMFGPLPARLWKAITETAGVPDVQRHDLRRTFVTRLARSGVDVAVTMRLSDHRDLRTVLQSYREVTADDQKKALQKAFGG